MQDFTKQIRSCIDQRREEQLEITVSSVADLFIEQHADQVEQWKDELLHNAIVNKVRSLLQRLEADGTEQMVLDGIEFPTYICTNSENGGNAWLHVDDATKQRWHSWLDISERNRDAVDTKHAKRRELVAFMDTLMGDDEHMTTREAVDLYLQRAAAPRIPSVSIGQFDAGILV